MQCENLDIPMQYKIINTPEQSKKCKKKNPRIKHDAAYKVPDKLSETKMRNPRRIEKHMKNTQKMQEAK